MPRFLDKIQYYDTSGTLRNVDAVIYPWLYYGTATFNYVPSSSWVLNIVIPLIFGGQTFPGSAYAVGEVLDKINRTTTIYFPCFIVGDIQGGNGSGAYYFNAYIEHKVNTSATLYLYAGSASGGGYGGSRSEDVYDTACELSSYISVYNPTTNF